MRGVSLLIRLAQHELEERRSDLGGISQAQADNESAIASLRETVAIETKTALADPATLSVFSAWASQSARGGTRLRNISEELHRSAEFARESIRDTAAQVRRLEIALDTMNAKERRNSARKADYLADEREQLRQTDSACR